MVVHDDKRMWTVMMVNEPCDGLEEEDTEHFIHLLLSFNESTSFAMKRPLAIARLSNDASVHFRPL